MDPVAESLFAEWLDRHETGDVPDFEALCKKHPLEAPTLRRIHRKWLMVQAAVGTRPEGASSSTDPRKRASPYLVLARLADRGPGSHRYQVQGEVAQGGMGVVLRVWDEDLQRHLAMKVMLGKGQAHTSGDTPPVESRLLTRFLEEAQVTGQLDHPGIVPVHDLGLDQDGHVYFTMKLVHGRTLRQVFEEFSRGKGGWTFARVLGLILKVCEAMSYAHAKGIIHRDLKPSNVMIGRFGEVYVMDWGLAKVLDGKDSRDIRLRVADSGSGSTPEQVGDQQDTRGEDASLVTMDGDVVGTPAYMPPEQARGELARMGPHSDVYAVGAMLYHLIAGHMPYVKPQERLNNYAVLLRVQAGPPQPLAELAPDAPPELSAICEKALGREPEMRFRDMSELGEELSAYVDGRVVKSYESGAWAEASKWVGRNKPLAASLAAAVLAVVAGGISFAIKANEATKAAALARRNEAKAEARADDVLRLSALQDLEDLLARANELWPAHPEKVANLRSWIADAEALVAELPRHRAKREELRALALPQSEEEQRHERESHPDSSLLDALQGELTARRVALLQRRDAVAAELPEIDWSTRPAEAGALNELAWPLVEPERTKYGREAEGLVLAQRALELTGDDKARRAMIGATLAWALFAVGRDDEALAASVAALEAAPEDGRGEYEENLSRLGDAVKMASSAEGLKRADDETRRVEHELTELEQRVRERRDWRFPEQHVEARWWNAQLSKLIEGLEALQDAETGLLSPEGVSPDFGWSVARRLTYAQELETAFGEDGQYAQAWTEGLTAIREAYPGLDLTRQMGLVPIGPDPESGLWEFAHLMTGVPAERDQDGKLLLTEETGVVLVLLPASTFWMGAQSTEPNGTNYDPHARERDGPVHEVELSAFFLSKYELTQGQWLTLTGSNPSFYQPPRDLAPTLLHPVDQVSWLECMTWLSRAGLSLPSEAQWEHGARGGTETPWWTGAERETLQEYHAANLADSAAARAGITWSDIKDWPDLDDGYAAHAPIGTYTANALGLHEVVGNMWEWCLDDFDAGFYGRSPIIDPVCHWDDAAFKVFRGGAFSYSAVFARSAERGHGAPTLTLYAFGVRPARAIEP